MASLDVRLTMESGAFRTLIEEIRRIREAEQRSRFATRAIGLALADVLDATASTIDVDDEDEDALVLRRRLRVASERVGREIESLEMGLVVPSSRFDRLTAAVVEVLSDFDGEHGFSVTTGQAAELRAAYVAAFSVDPLEEKTEGGSDDDQG